MILDTSLSKFCAGRLSRITANAYAKFVAVFGLTVTDKQKDLATIYSKDERINIQKTPVKSRFLVASEQSSTKPSFVQVDPHVDYPVTTTPLISKKFYINNLLSEVGIFGNVKTKTCSKVSFSIESIHKYSIIANANVKYFVVFGLMVTDKQKYLTTIYSKDDRINVQKTPFLYDGNIGI